MKVIKTINLLSGIQIILIGVLILIVQSIEETNLGYEFSTINILFGILLPSYLSYKLYLRQGNVNNKVLVDFLQLKQVGLLIFAVTTMLVLSFYATENLGKRMSSLFFIIWVLVFLIQFYYVVINRINFIEHCLVTKTKYYHILLLCLSLFIFAMVDLIETRDITILSISLTFSAIVAIEAYLIYLVNTFTE